MSKTSEKSYKVTATIQSVKGTCAAGHKAGDSIEINCYQSGNLCGFFYHALFADLQTFEYGGKLPWWEENAFEAGCPDLGNLVTMRLVRTEQS